MNDKNIKVHVDITFTKRSMSKSTIRLNIMLSFISVDADTANIVSMVFGVNQHTITNHNHFF